jgi:hypothetical protein
MRAFLAFGLRVDRFLSPPSPSPRINLLLCLCHSESAARSLMALSKGDVDAQLPEMGLGKMASTTTSYLRLDRLLASPPSYRSILLVPVLTRSLVVIRLRATSGAQIDQDTSCDYPREIGTTLWRKEPRCRTRQVVGKMKRKVWWQVTVVLNIENLARPSSSSNPFDNEGYRCRLTRAPQIKSCKPSER